MKFLIMIIAAVFSFSLNAEAELVVEGQAVETQDTQAVKKPKKSNENWDETLEEIKKERGFRKVKDRLEDIGDMGVDGLDKLFNALEQISIDFSLKASLDIVDGLELKGRYEYEAEPAFYGNYFSRLDGYTVGLKIKFLELLGLDSIFGISAYPDLRVKFYQFFDELSDARKPSNGYLPNRVPLKAEDARDKLKPGDLVMIDGSLNYAYGLGKVWDEIVDWLKFRLRGYRSINGRFRAFVFRADQDLVRVRVSTLRDTPFMVTAKLSVFDLFDLGWSKLTDLVERMLKLNKLVKAEMQWVDRDLWLADYTLDLSDPRVRNAYDAVFERKGRYRGIFRMSNPFSKADTLDSRLFELVAPLTEIAKSEQNKANPSAVINFMGSNYSNGEHFEFEGGVSGAFRGEILRSKKDNRLKQTLYTADGDPYDKHYFFPSWVRRKRYSGGVTLFREKKHQAANIIYTATPDYEIEEFENIGFYREETDKDYGYNEHLELLESFQNILPPDVFDDFVNYLASKGWGQFKKNRQNVRISARYFINKGGLKRVEHVEASQIKKLLLDALHELDMQQGIKKFGFAGLEKHTGSHIPKQACPLEDLRAAGAKTWKKIGRDQWKMDPEGEYLSTYTFKYCKKVDGFVEKLEQSLRPGLEAKERHEIFSSFTKSTMFLKLGPGILFDILGAASKDISDLTFFEIVFNASGQKEPVRFSRGKIENRPLYEIILQMERILNDDQPDMRLPGTEESIVRRIEDAS